ncbi:MAG: efflux RND transporter periplasmic adaptor subunit [Opitutaceae bacterium]|jgi:RND family efflux transporter MFP subunit
MTPFLRTFAFLCMILFSVTACRRHAEPVSADAGPVVAVRTALAEEARQVRVQLVAGTLRPVDHAVVSTQVMGSVAAADFAVGQPVAAGDLLVTLSADELDARLAQAQAALDAVARDHARESLLLDKGVSTSEAVRSLADRLRGAEAAVKEAKTLLGYTRVRAPFSGVIAQRLVQKGDLATAGAPLFSIEGANGLRAEIEVPASLSLLAVGEKLTVQLSDGTEVVGTLEELATAADPQTRTRLAKVALPAFAPAAHSGDFVRVAWPAGEVTTITVPVESVSVFGQMERVFVVEQGRAHLRLVKTAGSQDGRMRIAAGLNAGETVVMTAPVVLRDGQRVEVQP